MIKLKQRQKKQEKQEKMEKGQVNMLYNPKERNPKQRIFLKTMARK